MKKAIKYLENISILLVLGLMIMLFIIFIYHIKHQYLDTTYMWNIKYANLNIKEGSKKGNISLTDNNLNLEVTFLSNEYYEFTLDIINEGSLDAYVKEINFNVDSSDNILKYSLSYLDGKPINVGDVLSTNEKNTIKVRIESPNTDKNREESKLKLTLNIAYEAKK